jgi:hypothetical protein
MTEKYTDNEITDEKEIRLQLGVGLESFLK